MTDITPELPKDDNTFLQDVLGYSTSMTSKISMQDFKANWAPRFFSGIKDQQDQALEDWERLVAFGRNKPVFLFDANEKIKWVFPPILGEFKPKYSGDPNSLFSVGMEIAAITNRMKSQGKTIGEKVYPSRGLESHNIEAWQYQLHLIRMECGYPYPGQELPTPKGTGADPSTPLLSQPDEYDF